MRKFSKTILILLLVGIAVHDSRSMANALDAQLSYFNLSKPKPILTVTQAWEGDQQVHTLSVVELNRGGYRYWGYYGLHEGRGTGLARSNDLKHWTKFEGNPLWLNARWTQVLAHADPSHPERLYYAVTRDYDSDLSSIVLASSDDGIHLTQLKTLVAKNAGGRPRNQNPNLFRDPLNGKFILTFYGGNDKDDFNIISKSADRIDDIDQAPEKTILHDTDTVAAPNLIYVPNRLGPGKGVYYLATEIFPGRFGDNSVSEWQVKIFYSDRVDGGFVPTHDNPVQVDGRACLFQHVFNGKYYGFQSHVLPSNEWQMEVLTAPLTPDTR